MRLNVLGGGKRCCHCYGLLDEKYACGAAERFRDRFRSYFYPKPVETGDYFKNSLQKVFASLPEVVPIWSPGCSTSYSILAIFCFQFAEESLRTACGLVRFSRQSACCKSWFRNSKMGHSLPLAQWTFLLPPELSLSHSIASPVTRLLHVLFTFFTVKPSLLFRKAINARIHPSSGRLSSCFCFYFVVPTRHVCDRIKSKLTSHIAKSKFNKFIVIARVPQNR